MTIYSISSYGQMLADETRVGAYVEALRRFVTPDSVVLDLGTGIGFFAILAAKLGARRVYGVDTNEAIEVARQMATDNGVADRVELRRADSLEIDLPERADLLVCDVRGILPWAFGSVALLIDARQRHLSEAGTIIPLRDRLYAAVIEHREEVEEMAVWKGRPWDVDIGAGWDFVVNQRRKSKVEAEQMVSEPCEVATLEYATVTSPHMRGSAETKARRSGPAHGLAVWFDAELAEGIGFSNRPGEPELIYGQMFFPWPEEVALVAGERIEISLRADYVNGEYVWTWDTSIRTPENEERRRFHQSNFFGVFPSQESRLARSATHRPSLSERGRATRTALERMEEGDSLEEVARYLTGRFPELFADVGQAQGFAGDLAVQFGRPSD